MSDQDTSRPAAWLVTGVPGAGKSTVARMLACRLPRAAHIEGDLLQDWIVSGGVLPRPEPDEEATRQLELRARNASALARNFADAGFVPVIDDVIASRARLATYREALGDLPLRLVVLAPPLDVVLHRDRHRGYKQAADEWTHLAEEQRVQLSGTGLWLDSGPLTPEATVDAILEWADSLP